MRAINRINKYLKIFNQESDEEYKNFIGDYIKPYPALSGYVKIRDFDNGAIANVIEYSMQLSDFLIDQLDVSKAEVPLLDEILESYYDKKRDYLESNIDYYNRSNEEIFDHKVSNLAIANKLEDFGDDVLVIDGIGGNSGYYGVSYYNNLEEFALTGENVVKRAVYSIPGGRPYFFTVIMSNVFPDDYKNIIEVINEYKAGGVNYIVELTEYFSQAIAFFDTAFFEYNENNLTASPVITAGFFGT